MKSALRKEKHLSDLRFDEQTRHIRQNLLWNVYHLYPIIHIHCLLDFGFSLRGIEIWILHDLQHPLLEHELIMRELHPAGMAKCRVHDWHRRRVQRGDHWVSYFEGACPRGESTGAVFRCEDLQHNPIVNGETEDGDE